jgi:hypothetical protein
MSSTGLSTLTPIRAVISVASTSRAIIAASLGAKQSRAAAKYFKNYNSKIVASKLLLQG